MKRSTPRKRGRPPAGASGEKVSSYPRSTVRLSTGVMAELKAWSLINHQPIWRLVEDAISQAIAREPSEARELIRKVAQRRQATPSAKDK